jgi:retron-type reverse transcriptase
MDSAVGAASMMRWVVGIKSRKVNWILDTDIRSFFDEIDHGWMLKFLEHRIADRRLLGDSQVASSARIHHCSWALQPL